MDKNVCFFIENKALLLDKVLVSFNDTPIFFICCDGCDYYIVLCTNIEDLEYIIVKATLESLYKMLVQKVDMRSLFLRGEYFWSVRAGMSMEEDHVEQMKVEDMNKDVLPYPDARYEVIHEDDVAYVDRITAEYFREIQFEAIETPHAMEEISTSFMGAIIGNVQKITQYLDFGPVSRSPFTGLKKRLEYTVNEVKNEIQYSEQMDFWGRGSLKNDFETSANVGKNPIKFEAA